MICKKEQNKFEKTPWGSLTWFASEKIGNSKLQTVGRCVIDAGQCNPRHYHPNCEEILYVLEGSVLHTFGDESLEMEAGDTITVPAGIMHNAINNGSGQAVMHITFSSADRQTVAE